jgi:hypothetical protein
LPYSVQVLRHLGVLHRFCSPVHKSVGWTVRKRAEVGRDARSCAHCCHAARSFWSVMCATTTAASRYQPSSGTRSSLMVASKSANIFAFACPHCSAESFNVEGTPPLVYFAAACVRADGAVHTCASAFAAQRLTPPLPTEGEKRDHFSIPFLFVEGTSVPTGKYIRTTCALDNQCYTQGSELGSLPRATQALTGGTSRHHRGKRRMAESTYPSPIFLPQSSAAISASVISPSTFIFPL